MRMKLEGAVFEIRLKAIVKVFHSNTERRQTDIQHNIRAQTSTHIHTHTQNNIWTQTHNIKYGHKHRHTHHNIRTQTSTRRQPVSNKHTE